MSPTNSTYIRTNIENNDTNNINQIRNNDMNVMNNYIVSEIVNDINIENRQVDRQYIVNRGTNVNVPFKLTTGEITHYIDINIEDSIKNVYNIIKQTILRRLNLPINDNNIWIEVYTYDLVSINTESNNAFKTSCDSCQFPAFYYKVHNTQNA